MSSRAWFLLAGVLTLCTAATVAWADDSQEKIARIKSAYLLNFMKFTTWPEPMMASKDSPIKLVVIGEDSLGESLDATFKDRTVQGHPVQIHRTQMPRRSRDQSRQEHEREVSQWLAGLRDAYMVYVCESDDQPMSLAVRALSGGTTLVVADSMEVMRHGAMLGLALEEGRVVFYADRGEIDASGVVVSSQVLKLARQAR